MVALADAVDHPVGVADHLVAVADHLVVVGADHHVDVVDRHVVVVDPQNADTGITLSACSKSTHLSDNYVATTLLSYLQC